MKLYEFESDQHELVMLLGIISQIHNRIVDTGFNKKYKLSSLLSILRDREIDISPEQFRDMIVNPPLNNFIANVSGDYVIFKGGEDTSTDVEKPDQTTDTLEKMAKRAAKT